MRFLETPSRLRRLLTPSANSLVFGAAILLATLQGAGAQQPGSYSGVDSLVALALARNPELQAGEKRVAAARARVAPAGSRADPMLMVGVLNVPARSLSLTEDDMTMKMVGVRQELPYPGKLGLMRRIAELEAEQIAVELDSVRLSVIRNVKDAYFEIGYIDAALETTRRTHQMLLGLAQVTEARYAAGRGEQQEVVRATLAATRINEAANAFIESRRVQLEILSSLLDRDIEIPAVVGIPSRLAAAAIPSNLAAVQFRSNQLGASVAGSPLPSLDSLQAIALAHNAGLRRQRLVETATAASLALSRKQHLPDFDVSLEYGQRSGRSAQPPGAMGRDDMISLTVSVPLTIQRGRKQSALVTAASADLAAAAAQQRAAGNLLRAEVARTYSEIERSRTRLALYVKALLPQARASMSSATTSYQSGTGIFIAILEAQKTLLDLELDYHRSLSDFAQRIAELDAMTGQETLR
ncbi:MAG: TolC family protein [Gemmatimonadaceae bacterium]|nr:TolC family protein [Gemmatimonadaceae bacterium]